MVDEIRDESIRHMIKWSEIPISDEAFRLLRAVFYVNLFLYVDFLLGKGRDIGRTAVNRRLCCRKKSHFNFNSATACIVSAAVHLVVISFPLVGCCYSVIHAFPFLSSL